MENSIVRVQKIEIDNFKNVDYGVIEFKSKPKKDEEYKTASEILGLYGQNGSGKTTLVNAFNFLKCILEGSSLPEDTYNYINLFKSKARLMFEFYIEINREKYLVDYEFWIEKLENKRVRISKEKLSYSKKEEIWSNKITIIDYDLDYEKVIFKPQNKYNEVVLSNKENLINLKVAQKLSLEKNTSFIFNKEVKEILSKSFKSSDYAYIVESLVHFARCNLFVIMNDYTGIISANILKPFKYQLEKEEGITQDDIAPGFGGTATVTKSVYEILTKLIRQMNVVLKHIVPTLEIELYNHGEQYNEKGEIVTKVELLSIKGNSKLPIRYESEGIRKIISIISALIEMYNEPAVCMVVDELDSGIYEYLLGEILKVIEMGGKGQLIFTSHNLRPLEVLNKDSLYFTTTNPNNRYIRFSNVKSNNNLRSLYIRSISLGGQKEELYNETDSQEIRRAFRLAGEKFDVI